MDMKIRAEVLADWDRCLYSQEGWRNPFAHYRYLMRLADDLLRLGQIDLEDRFERIEILIGAFTHHVEETPVSWRNPAADYEAYNSAGFQTGSVNGNRYYLHGAGIEPGPMEFFAQIHDADDNGEHPIITRTYQPYGRLAGRYIFTDTGSKLALVEKTVMVNGASVTRLDDPDTYRAIVDAALLALEDGDMVRYIALWQKENFSIFRQCSACCDRFELREDCAACAGMGFVEDPECPSKLPPGFVGQPRINVGELG